jgi:hypothetical protein
MNGMERSWLSKYHELFIELISDNAEMMNDLSVVRSLELPHGHIAAGYVRNYVWDYLHGYQTRTPLNDIDLIYYNKDELDEVVEKKLEQQLKQATGNPLWSVKNQARMHIQNGDRPYQSIQDAISYWPETATAVAIRLESDDRISYVCPHGLDDMFECRVRQSPLFKDEAYYQKRVRGKQWEAIWPKLTFIGL